MVFMMSIIPKFTYKFKEIPIEISANVFVEVNKLILKCIQKCNKKIRIIKIILQKQSCRIYASKYQKKNYERPQELSAILAQGWTKKD